MNRIPPIKTDSHGRFMLGITTGAISVLTARCRLRPRAEKPFGSVLNDNVSRSPSSRPVPSLVAWSIVPGGQSPAFRSLCDPVRFQFTRAGDDYRSGRPIHLAGSPGR